MRTAEGDKTQPCWSASMSTRSTNSFPAKGVPSGRSSRSGSLTFPSLVPMTLLRLMRRPIRELCPARMIVCSSRSPTLSLPGACKNIAVRLLGVSSSRWPTVTATDFVTFGPRSRARFSPKLPYRRLGRRAWRRAAVSTSLSALARRACRRSGRMAAIRSVSAAISSSPMKATSMSLRTERTRVRVAPAPAEISPDPMGRELSLKSVARLRGLRPLTPDPASNGYGRPC